MADIICEIEGPVATVTLNRPDAMNALSSSLCSELHRTAVGLDADDQVRVVILTGAGARAFSAGLDLKELASSPDALKAANAQAPEVNPTKALACVRKPVIGAINGFAITGGFELALACDFLIASTNARFADTHGRVGIFPGWGLSQKLSRLIGIGRAKEMSFSGNFIDADTAEQWGLVNRVVSPAELLPAAHAIARDIASADPAFIIAYKQLVDDGYAKDFGSSLKHEHTVSSRQNAGLTPETIEARRKAVQERGRAQ
jgi:enoyl-CoA hydratase